MTALISRTDFRCHVIFSFFLGKQGHLTWTDAKWIPFLDSMLQIQVLSEADGLRLPTRIKTVRIDPQLHLKMVAESNTCG